MIVIVAGVTRSGSSLTMQMLEAGGLPVAGEFPAYEPFPLGTVPWHRLEGRAVKLIDTQRWFPIPDGDYRVILCSRNHQQQGKSIAKILRAMGVAVSKLQERRMTASIDADYDQIARWAKQQSARATLHFEDTIESPVEAAKRMAKLVGQPLDIEAMAKVVVKRTPKCYDGMLEYQLMEGRPA